VRSGLPIAQAVALSADAAGGWHGRQGPQWSHRLQGGDRLADCLVGEWPLAVAMIRAGEHSGRLPELCQHLAETAKQFLALRDRALGQAAYPALVITCALAVPGLPGLVAGNNGVWLVLGPPLLFWGLLAAIVGGCWLVPAVRERLARMALASPLAWLLWPWEVSIASRIIAAGYAAGLLAPDCLDLAADAALLPQIRERAQRAAHALRQNRLNDLPAALQAIGWPTLWLNQAAAGETAGRGEATLNRIADDAYATFAFRLDWLVRILCGAFYGLAVLATAITVISMYAGMLQQTMKLLPTE
jgi:type II secretory pathway component PulF